MGECIRYGKELVKIGTMENLYFVSYDKFLAYDREVSSRSEEKTLSVYLNPEYGFRFRFPFPDEDSLKFGSIIEPYNRTVDILLDQAVANKLLGDSDVPGCYKIGLAMQRPVLRESDGMYCLALVVKDHLTGGLHRFESDREVKLIVSQVVKHHILPESDPQKRHFFRLMARRILKGYRLKAEVSQYLNIKKVDSKNNSQIEAGTTVRPDMQNREQAQRAKEMEKVVSKVERKLLREARKRSNKPGRPGV